MTDYSDVTEIANDHGERMKPVSVNGLFGWLHAHPEHAGGDVAVLICQALAEDAFDSHHALRVLADGFAAAGYPAMRFNYPDTGDSADVTDAGPWVAEHWAAWQQSVHDAADWLRDVTGARRLIFCGLRIGAALAILAAERRDDVAALILLAPVLRGRSYLRQLWIEAQLQNDGNPARSERLDFHELHLSPETLHLIGQLDLRQANLQAGHTVAIFSQSDSILLSQCVAEWTTRGADVTCSGFDGLEPMLRDYVDCEYVPVDISPIIEWTRRAIPAQPSQSPVAAMPTSVTLRLPGCIETPLGFGPDKRLFGVLCRPDKKTGKIAVVIVNCGRAPHYGVGRFGVEFARRLAILGIASLRIDFAGLGDSLGPTGRENLRTTIFETDRVADICAAIDVLERLGYRQFAVHGICSGAYHAFQSALADRRVNMLLLVNLPLFIWRQGDTMTFLTRKANSFGHYLLKLTNKSDWSQILKGGTTHRAILRAQFERLYKSVQSTVRHLLGERFTRSDPRTFARDAMATLSRRSAKTMFLFAPDDFGLCAIERTFGRRGARLRAFQGVSMQVVPELDHDLRNSQARRVAADLMVDFLSSSSIIAQHEEHRGRGADHQFRLTLNALLEKMQLSKND